MNRRQFLKGCALSLGALTAGGCSMGSGAGQTVKGRGLGRPNIVYILADDMGYGDLSCLNKDSKIHTPHLDRLAGEGMIFTDAHSGSAVCTPTRYGIMTGRYSWRGRLKEGAIDGYSPPLIEPGRMTVASMLKEQGYATSYIGKWHLGWDWAKQAEDPNEVDYHRPIKNGPRSKGFDYSFCLPASLDMVPYVYVENDRVTAAPNRIVEGREGKELLREGPTGADFEHIEVLGKLMEKATGYIRERGRQKESPFFLYFAMPAPHTPILPTEAFRGKSGTTTYGDFVLQVDWTVGQVLSALKENGFEEDTLVVFTSDNGCAPHADLDELAQVGHDPSYVFRGHKADIFEGGHRMPHLTRWPKRIRPGSVCDETICLTDLMATAADIVGYALPDNAGEDSVSLLPYLLGTADGPLREAVVHHSVNGSFAIRQGRWKLVLCSGSGGWSAPRPNSEAARRLPPVQLYDLHTDIGETKNLQAQHPEVVERLTSLLQRYVDQGRSTPGRPQEVMGEIRLFR